MHDYSSFEKHRGHARRAQNNEVIEAIDAKFGVEQRAVLARSGFRVVQRRGQTASPELTGNELGDSEAFRVRGVMCRHEQ